MKRILRISTRGYYDLGSGKTLKKNRYFLYPKTEFKKLVKTKEITIMIHGLRNDNAGAMAKVVLARNRLCRLGYNFPVVGFSYDSNTTGAHMINNAKHALVVGQNIAKKNGKHLRWFIEDFKSTSPNTRIRLMGHSLGSQVILSALESLFKNSSNKDIVESVHLFGASITSDVPSSKRYGKILQNIVRKKIINYFAPTDDVLVWADDKKYVLGPLGLNGAIGKTMPKYHQRKVTPKNHRFASYAAVLKSFP